MHIKAQYNDKWAFKKWLADVKLGLVAMVLVKFRQVSLTALKLVDNHPAVWSETAAAAAGGGGAGRRRFLRQGNVETAKKLVLINLFNRASFS